MNISYAQLLLLFISSSIIIANAQSNILPPYKDQNRVVYLPSTEDDTVIKQLNELQLTNNNDAYSDIKKNLQLSGLHTTQSSQQQQKQTECIDTPNYKDIYGDKCSYYTMNYPQACNYFGSIGEDDNQTSPNENCCVCIELLQQQLLPSTTEPTLEPTHDEISSYQSLQPSTNDLSTTEEPTTQQLVDQISIHPSLESSIDDLLSTTAVPSLRPSRSSSQPSSQPSSTQYVPSESPSISISQYDKEEETYAPTPKASLLFQPTSSPVVTTTSTYATAVGSTTTSTSATTTQTITESTSSAKTIKPTFQPTYDQNCTDTPNYTDIYNDTCDYYALPNNYPYACQYFGNINNTTNQSPNQNCCVCSQIIPPYPLKWYPINRNSDETIYSVPWQSDYISCIYGNDYPIEYYIQLKMRELVLFDSYDECCDSFARVEACRPTSSPSVLTDLMIKSSSGYLTTVGRSWWTILMFWVAFMIPII